MILQADARHIPLADNSVQCVVTSPPYWGLRDYGVNGQLGLERTPEEYVANMVAVFREVRRTLREDGTCWVNMGDSYATSGHSASDGDTKGKHLVGGGMRSWGEDRQAVKATAGISGLKPKDLVGIPWRLAFALQADGWWLRSEIIWSKPNPMPESVTDRPTKSHEQIFLLTKSAKYFFDQEAVREPHVRLWDESNGGSWSYGKGDAQRVAERGKAGTHSGPYPLPNPAGRNLRSVWTIPTQPYPDAHFATFPEALAKRCILAGTSARGACAACGAPWERVVDTSYTNPGNRSNNGPRSLENRKQTAGFSVRLERSTSTTGWRPYCSCDGGVLHGELWTAGVIPCPVLDPFAGSGTTVAVAESLGRRGIGLELKAEYIALARKRLSTVTMGLPL